jgi:hypothetical protein
MAQFLSFLGKKAFGLFGFLKIQTEQGPSDCGRCERLEKSFRQQQLQRAQCSLNVFVNALRDQAPPDDRFEIVGGETVFEEVPDDFPRQFLISIESHWADALRKGQATARNFSSSLN